MKNNKKAFLKFLLIVCSYIIVLSLILLWGYFFNETLGFYILYVVIFSTILFSCTFLPFFIHWEKKKKSNLLFDWLDSIYNKDISRRIIEDEIKRADILENLEITQKKILVYANYNKNRLNLIKALIKTRNHGHMLNYVKLFIPITISTVLYFLKEPIVQRYLKGEENSFYDSEVIQFINIVIIVLILIGGMAVIVIDVHEGRRREMLIEEIVDSCIKKIEDDSKRQ
ncbi:MAG: hypothetical protein ACI4XL_13540 [Bacillus sp. (in: firmicutes)]